MEDKINNPSNLIIAGVAPWNEPDSHEIRSIDIRLTLCIHTCAIRILRNSFVEISPDSLSSRNNIKIRRISPASPIRTNLAWSWAKPIWDGIDLISNFEEIQRMKPNHEIPRTRYRRYRVLIRHFFVIYELLGFLKVYSVEGLLKTVSIKGLTCIEFCVWYSIRFIFYIWKEWNLFFDEDLLVYLMIRNYIARN